ncbi:nucleoside hydrolase [Nocardiopsis halotolerans]|uniref:nucleoside hydrolase n=1 Tax=Nocardiopsis halotolerans TaxID=124252 RepID=UPI00034DF01F|nr:nucleoside hydrolase [Nocardiopsis halotolerans]
MPYPEDDDRSVDGPRDARKDLVARGERTPPDSAPGIPAGRTRAGGPWSESEQAAPLVLDTDIGGDPDDAIAVAAAARTVPGLALVLTNDETGGDTAYGQRARLARHLLDLLGRDDVPVVAGHGVGGTRYFCEGPLVPSEVPEQPRDVVSAVRGLLERSGGTVRWVGMGSLSNLARVLKEVPEARERLRVTQMGGALNYRDPSRAEHNFRMDTDAAHAVFEELARGRLTDFQLVTSDVTFRPEIEVTRDSALYGLFADGDGGWRGLLRHHLDLWFEAFHPGSIQHDALALTTALRMPHVSLSLRRVALDDLGRMSRSERGAEVWLSSSARYAPFLRWLEGALSRTEAETPPGPARPGENRSGWGSGVGPR